MDNALVTLNTYTETLLSPRAKRGSFFIFDTLRFGFGKVRNIIHNKSSDYLKPFPDIKM